jgi:hypothetical protein
MVGCYLSSLPKQAMRSIAGFNPPVAGSFFLPRAIVEPDDELQKIIFPKVEEWLSAFDKRSVQEDIAGPNFLNVLKYLRIVLLQVIYIYIYIYN